MKRYLLRRIDEEIGPFSFEELKMQKLQPSDLIWINEESAKWKHPGEIEELKELVLFNLPSQSEIRSFTSYNRELKVLDRPLHKKAKRLISFFFSRSLVEKILSPTSQLSWALVVTTVLMFDFFIIKAIVQGFEYYPPGYIAIKNALKKDPPGDGIDKNYQNALVKEVISASDTGHKTKGAKAELVDLSGLKKLLEIKSNKYHVISSGGVNNLVLTVFNHSAYLVETVTVQVDYLGRKGHLVQTEAFTTNFVKPNSSKKIHIPANNKGKKVKYRITNIRSSECSSKRFEV